MNDVISRKLFNKVLLGLLVSLICNIVLACFAVYSSRQLGQKIMDRSVFCPSPVSVVTFSHSLTEQISLMKKRPCQELISELRNQTICADGYRVCDVALALLVQDHFFDLARVYVPVETRLFSNIYFFPAIAPVDFARIISFAETERFPYTAEGLFVALQRDPDNEQLQGAFTRTAEYLLIDTLLHRTFASTRSLDQKNILALLLSGNWQLIATFVQEQRSAQDLSQEKRVYFIASYISLGSKLAAQLLATQERDLAISLLDDVTLQKVLVLLEDTKERQQIAKILLQRPRSEALLATCRMCIADASTDKIDIVTSPIKNKVIVYSVQEGDSLWKISRKFHVDMDRIREKNHLTSDSLKPGLELVIPLQ